MTKLNHILARPMPHQGGRLFKQCIAAVAVAAMAGIAHAAPAQSPADGDKAKRTESGTANAKAGANAATSTKTAAPAVPTGENLMKCMANTEDALPRCRSAAAGQPRGIYCHARTADDLQPCFANMRAEILRITR